MQNVTPIPTAALNVNSERVNSATSQISPTLDAVLAEFEQWRAHKPKLASPIPGALWEKIFQLAKIHSPTKIRALFNISTKQYQKKWEEKNSSTKEILSSTTTISPIPVATPTANSPELCAIKLKPSTYQSQPLPSAKTIVVEFCREDGRRMSIHTTQDSISILMQDFFKG